MTRKNWLLTSIWSITLIPLFAAWIMAYTGWGIPSSTKNKGELVSPNLIVPDTMIAAQNGNWGLVVISDQCPAYCQQQLYKMQQLYLSMGKQAERLQTIWVSNTKRVEAQALTVDIAFQAANEVATAQRDELSFKKMIQFNQPHLFHWFSTQAIHWQDQSIFLVDPKGNIALRFRPDLSGKEMISDIKWLFKASRLG